LVCARTGMGAVTDNSVPVQSAAIVTT
jgi:hypothetical protein